MKCEKGKRKVICKEIRHAGQRIIAHASRNISNLCFVMSPTIFHSWYEGNR